MDHDELARILVMRAIADDYEDLPTIAATVDKWAEERRFRVNRSQIVASLERAIEKGLARAYRPGLRSLERLDGVPSAAEVHECYFRLTPEGVAEARRLLPGVWTAADLAE